MFQDLSRHTKFCPKILPTVCLLLIVFLGNKQRVGSPIWHQSLWIIVEPLNLREEA